MLINLIEYEARRALLSLIEDINRVQTSVWGLVFIKRRSLTLITNDAFVLAVKPAFENVAEAKIFVMENGDIYAAWRGMQKRVREQLTAIVDGTLRREEAKAESESCLTYFDPQVMGNEIATLLRAQQKEVSRSIKHAYEHPPGHSKNIPKPTELQLEHFQEAMSHRRERKQLQVLIVEDQQLLRRLLHEVLRAEHAVDSVATLHDGWKTYLEKAPDVAFLDIGLADGNGHDLAQAIKQIDPESCVIMVTANNTQDEIDVAKHNHVDGFVAKPYSKQQIFNYISRHVGAQRLAAARHTHA